MLPALHGLNSLHEVYMVWRDDTNSIDVITHFIKHHPEVRKLACSREGIHDLLIGALKINITKGDWLRSAINAEPRNHFFAATTYAYATEVDSLTRREVPKSIGLAEREIRG
jgi:hypothetical protein